MTRRLISFIAIVLVTVSALGGLSPQFSEWRDGPAQWIMTSDEKRAWRQVATDDAAVAFIELFWARRDPSTGTAVNEFRNEFDSRVRWADEKVPEARKRGAMTDRGRVYIVLGAGTNMNAELRTNDQQQGAGADTSVSGTRQRGARETWIWDYKDAKKFDMSRIEVVFIEDPGTRRIQRDPRRADFSLAEAVALRKAIVNPDLTAPPDWAATDNRPSVAVAPTPSDPVAVAETEPPLAEPATASSTPGVSRLLFLRSGSINARSASDPFAVPAATTFAGGSDVPWAAQYCSANANVPNLTTMLVISGPLDAKPKEQATRPKEAKAERLTARAGCYALQGMVPVSKLEPGRYKLTVLIDDVKTKDAYSIKGEFRLE
jgi:GWxTD domain-containing protein